MMRKFCLVSGGRGASIPTEGYQQSGLGSRRRTTFLRAPAKLRLNQPLLVAEFQWGKPTDTPDPGEKLPTPQELLLGTPLQYVLAEKSSLPCPGEEALPRPKSLVGVGTLGLQVIALGPKGGPGLRSPSRPGVTKPS